MVLSTLLAFLLLSDRPLDFGAVTEAEHNPLFGINGQGVDHGVPKPLIEFGHKILCPAQFFQINLDAFPLCSPLGKVLLQGIVLGFGGFIPLDHGIVLLCVHFRLNGNAATRRFRVDVWDCPVRGLMVGGMTVIVLVFLGAMVCLLYFALRFLALVFSPTAIRISGVQLSEREGFDHLWTVSLPSSH